MFNKGVSGNIFKLIFSLVAGVLILIFLVRFAYQHVSLSGSLENREFVITFDNQLEAVGVADNAFKKLKFSDGSDIIFGCDFISSGGYNRKTNKIVFAPRDLNGKNLLLWTRAWDFPFKIENLYYLANKEDLFVLVYDDESFEYVTRLEFPVDFNVQKLDVKDFNIKNFKVKDINFVFFTKINNLNEILNELTGSRFNLMVVDLDNKGLKFYSAEGDYLESFYLGDEMLLGAIFSGEGYVCVKKRAIARLSLISEIYENKMNMLMQKSLDEDCLNGFGGAVRTLKSYGSMQDKNLLYNYMDKIKMQNKDLKKNGCASIY